MSINDVNNIFKKICNYKFINANRDTNMRNSKGTNLLDAISYRYKYTAINKTKESVRSDLIYNNQNSSTSKRQSFDRKESNIPSAVYSSIFNELSAFYNDKFGKTDKLKVFAIDGSYNTDTNYDKIMNMGVFDVTNAIPIALESFGKKGKNNEIACFKSVFLKDPSIFKSCILVADRAYFSYNFIRFLTDYNVKYIIRVQGEANNLDHNTILKKGRNYNDIMYLRDKVRVIKYNSTFTKTVYTLNPDTKNRKNAKKHIKHELTIKNDCFLVTNLLDINKYSDACCLDIYRSRWDIEVFFRYIKEKTKFAKLREDDEISNLKSYYCIITIELMVKIIIELYLNAQVNKNAIVDMQIKKNNIVDGIYDHFLNDLLNDKITEDKFIHFCKSYIVLYKTPKANRTYPRVSKLPYTKWYTKKHARMSEIKKIIIALKENDLSSLNKKLRSEANLILSINSVKCSNMVT